MNTCGCSVRSVIALLSAVAALTVSSRAEIVYDNTTNYLSKGYGPSGQTNEFGNSITLGGSLSNRYVTTFLTTYYLSPAGLFTGNETARIKFYDNTGPGGYPGNLLYDSGPEPITAGAVNYLTNNPNVVVPDSFTWAIQFAGLASGESGQLLRFYPPAVGSTSTNFVRHDSSGWQLFALSAPAAFFAQITAGPTPVNSAPSISTPPAGGVAFVGTDVTFEVIATGTPPLRYQWTFNGVNVANATNATFTLRNAATNQTGAYAVVVSNPSGSVTSAPPAMLNVIQGQVAFDNTANYLSFTATSTNEFGNQITLAGSSSNRLVTLFKVEFYLATNNVTGNERIQLRFYENGGLGGIPGKMLYDGGTLPMTPGFHFATVFPNLVVPDTFTWAIKFLGVATNETVALTLYGPLALGSVAAQYWENFSGTWAQRSIFGSQGSFGAYVVTDKSPAAVAPAIVNQPVGQTTTNGYSVTFHVTASGSPPLGYQWQLNGTALPGANYDTLLLTNVAPSQAGNYTVAVTNAVGAVTSQAAVLTVLVPPSITSQPPPSQTAAIGDLITFAVAASGSTPFQYQWYKSGSAIGGATNATFQLSSVTTNDVGNYQAVVSNAAGATVSSNSLLSVVYGRKVFDNTATSSGMSITSTNEFGSGVTLDGQPMDRKLMQFTFQYQLGANGTGHEKIDLRFYDNTGSNNSPGRLYYDSGPLPASPGPNYLTVYPAVEVPDSFIWTVQFSGVATNQTTSLPVYGPPVLGSTLTNFWEHVAGAAWVSGPLSNPPSGFAAEILAIGKSTNNPPVINSPIPSLTVTNGDTAVFSVNASGSIPLNYQWLWYGTNLAAPNNPFLTLTNATPALNGPYSVVITNGAGSITSQVATLTVLVPPAIQTPPQGQAVVVATNVTFTASASGIPAPNYQWSHNGALIPGATNSTLVLNNVTTNDAGAYIVTASNTAGVVSSAPANLAVALGWLVYDNTTNYLGITLASTNEYGDQITLGGDPLDRLVVQFQFEYDLPTNNVTGAELARLRFYDTNGTNNTPGATLYDSGTFVLKPGFNTVTNYPYVPVPDTFVWTVQFSGMIPGQKPALTIYDPPALGASGSSYWEKLSGAWTPRTVSRQNVNFNAWILANVKTTNVPPTILAQPLSLTATNGNNVMLSVTATGSVPLSYHWQFNGANLPEANIPLLVLNNINTNQAGNYSVVVTNVAGSVTSQVAVVSVLVPPTIQIQPQSQAVIIGTNVSLSVSAYGTAPLSYQWYVNGTPLSGATGPSLSMANVTADNSGAYTVVLSNIAGVVTSQPANLQVVPPPQVRLVYDNTATYLNSRYSSTNEAGSELLLAGSPLERTVLQFKFRYFLSPDATGTETARLKFYDNTGPNRVPKNLLYDSGPIGIVPGANDFTISPNVDVPGDFTWTAQFRGLSGSTIAGLLLYGPVTLGSSSNTFWEKISGNWTLQQFGGAGNFGVQLLAGPHLVAPAITGQPQSQTVVVGNDVTLAVGVAGTPPFGYQWLFNGLPLTNTTSGTLLLSSVAMAQAGAYQVVVTNYAGSATSGVAQLTVLAAPPTITLQPTNQSLALGNSITLTVAATGVPPLAYQWQLNGANLPGATNTLLTIANFQTSAVGSYTVVVTNPGGKTTSQPAILTVPGSPMMDSAPVAQSVSPGANVTLSVAAHGAGLQYQWQFNGQAIGGATNNNLVLAQLSAAQTGLYAVQISNTNGTILSPSAALNLLSLDLAPGRTARLTITGPIGSKYRIDARGAFNAGQPWTPQATVTLTSSPYLYLDPTSPTVSTRFYRAIWLP